MSLTHKIAVHPKDVIILSLSGKIIAENDFKEVLELIEQKLNQSERKYIIDLADVSHINSSGLNFLLRIFTKIRNKGGEMVVINISKSVEKLLSISKLNSIFTICADQDEALNNLNAQEA